jgi:hypothetical protein
VSIGKADCGTITEKAFSDGFGPCTRDGNRCVAVDSRHLSYLSCLI